MIRVATLCALALAGCARVEPERVAFCEVATHRPIVSEHVRVEAVGIFGGHGVMLKHPDCPTVSAQWTETDAFRDGASARVLEGAISELRRDVSPRASLDPEDLAVDFTARYHWRRGSPEFLIERVHSVRRVPTVYASEFERNFTRCEMGPLPGPRSEEWHAACDAADEWFRTERARNHN